MKLDNLKGDASPICIGKINTSNPKNKIYQAYKAKVKSIQDKKSEEMFKDRTFGDEYEAVKLTSDTLKLVFSFASACTVFVALNWALEPLLGSWLSIGIAFLICVILEALKSFVWSKLSKNVLKYKEYPLPLVVAAIFFNLASVGGSIFGASQLPSNEQEFNSKSVALINVDSIGADFDSSISGIDAIIGNQTNELGKTTSNSTKRSIAANIALQSEQKATLLEQKAHAIQLATVKNNHSIQEAKEASKKQAVKAQEQLESKRTNCMLVAALFEFGLMCCLIFGSYYLFRVEIDKTGGFEDQGETDGEQSSPTTEQTETNGVRHQNKQHSSIDKKQRPIGFKSYVDEERHTSTPTANVIKGDKLEYTRVCQLDECKKPFIHKNSTQKYCSDRCRKRAYQLNKKSK